MIILDGQIEMVQECDWMSPPHVSLHISYFLPPVRVTQLDFVPGQGLVETELPPTQHGNTQITVPKPTMRLIEGMRVQLRIL